MAYLNGKKIFLSSTNFTSGQSVPETITKFADLFDLADGVYSMPTRTKNKIYFPTSVSEVKTEVIGLIEVDNTNHKIIAYCLHKEITRAGTEKSYTYTAVNLSGKGLSTNDFTDTDKDEIAGAIEKVTELESTLNADSALANFLLWIDNYTEVDRAFSIYQRKSTRKKDGEGYSARYIRYDFDYDHPGRNLTLKAILNGKGTTSATGSGFSFVGEGITKLSASLSLVDEKPGLVPLDFVDLLIEGFDGISLFSEITQSKKRTFQYSNAKAVTLRGLNTKKAFNGFSIWTFADGGLTWTAADLRTARESETNNKLIIDASQVSDASTKIYFPDGGTDGSGYGDRCYAFDLFGFAEEQGKKNLLTTVTASLPFVVNSKVFEHTFYMTAEGLDVIKIFTNEF